MSESDDPAEAANRLEQALERIALLARRRSGTTPDPAPANTEQHVPGEIAERLDALIAQLRAGLR